MKKQILTFLVSITMLFGIAADGVSAKTAAPPDVSEKTPAVSEESPQPAAPEDIYDPFSRTGSFEKPEIHEMDPDYLPEFYEEKIDPAGKASAVYRYDWDKYSTNFYYNQLSQKAQAFWDRLDEMALGCLTGSESFSASRDADGNRYFPTKMFAYSDISPDEAFNTALIFKFSNPQYYFLKSLYTSPFGICFSVYEGFANGAARSRETAKMKAVIDDWIARINAEPDVLSKERLAHDLICEKVIYDPYYGTRYESEYHQVAYSVFCTDVTVCAGYSQAMQLLMNGAGIDCAVVTSKDHEWNIIRLNNIWYAVDLTWNDLTEEEEKLLGVKMVYDYFNRSSQMMQGKTESHTPEALWNGMLPELVYDSGADHYDIGTVYMPESGCFAPQISCNGSMAVLSAPFGTCYYTIDGTDPSIAFTKARKYTGPFELAGETRIRAVTTANGYFDSGISEAVVVPHYQVVLHANGGYIGKKGIGTSVRSGLLYGANAGSLVNPKRKGYAFLGWYTGKSGGSKITKIPSVTKDVTYYAHWAKIKPKKAVVSSARNNKAKTIKITVKKIASASGYQVRYSLRSNMASSKKKDSTANVCTVKGLKKGKTYYVQARMYQKDSVSGKKKYGKWSRKKTVLIKK